MTFGNGTPGVRLSPSGSHRVLGVFGGADADPESPQLLPRSVEARAASPTQAPFLDLTGDFDVCPLASDRAGWMRPVCITSAAHLALSHFQGNLPGGVLPNGFRPR